MAKQRLTDKTIASSVSLNDIVHIVKTGDTSQNPAGSSFKATVSQIVNTFTGGTSVTGFTFNNTSYDLSLSQSDGTSFTENLGILASDIKVTGGTYNPITEEITFVNNSGGTFVVTGISTTFTGNTSGSCITDLYVSNLYGCSPITIQNSIQQTGSTATGLLSVSFGNNNSVSEQYSFSVGEDNISSGDTSFSFGKENISGGLYSFAGGYGTKIYNRFSYGLSTDSQITQDFSSIFGGTTNRILETITSTPPVLSQDNSIFGGVSNLIDTGVKDTIVGGQSNTIRYNSTYSGVSVDNIIAGGDSNTIDGHGNSAIIGGNDNTINFSIISNNGIFVGSEHNISGGGFDVIIGGSANTISGIQLSVVDFGNSVIGGVNNRILTGNSSTIIGGKNNTLQSSTPSNNITNSIILGGENLVGSEDNTVYVDKLNINTIGGGVSLLNLGIDSNGNVVSGSTFTGNTSGSCITDLYVTNLYGCSPINIQDDTIINGGLTATTGLISSSTDSVLTIIGSGNSTSDPILSVQGSSGELFSVTDSLEGSLFSVNDISGLPILDVNSDSTIQMGSITAPSLFTTVLTTATGGTENIYSLPTSAYTGGFFEYTLVGNGGARSGNINSIWSGTTALFEEFATNDIGATTSGVTFDVSVSGNDAILSVSAITGTYTIKTIVRSI